MRIPFPRNSLLAPCPPTFAVYGLAVASGPSAWSRPWLTVCRTLMLRFAVQSWRLTGLAPVVPAQHPGPPFRQRRGNRPERLLASCLNILQDRSQVPQTDTKTETTYDFAAAAAFAEKAVSAATPALRATLYGPLARPVMRPLRGRKGRPDHDPSVWQQRRLHGHCLKQFWSSSCGRNVTPWAFRVRRCALVSRNQHFDTTAAEGGCVRFGNAAVGHERMDQFKRP